MLIQRPILLHCVALWEALWEKPPNDVSLVAYAKVAKVMPFNRCWGNINGTSHPPLFAEYFPLILNSNRKYLCRYLSVWEFMEGDNRRKPYVASLSAHFSYSLICRISSAVFRKNKHFPLLISLIPFQEPVIFISMYRIYSTALNCNTII